MSGRPQEPLPVFLIATPIGDILSDFSLSAFEILRRVRHVFLEDIGLEHPDLLHKRLQRKGILGRGQCLHFVSEHVQQPALFELLDRLVEQNEPFAVLTDKGLPCFLDPGLALVRHLLERHGQRVELVPVGASSALDAAIALSGVDCTRFVFLGHFPDCRDKARSLLSLAAPNIVYVAAGAWRAFGGWLQELLGHQYGRARVVVLSNMRQLQNRRRQEFSPLEDESAFLGYEETFAPGSPPANHVAVIHWGK